MKNILIADDDELIRWQWQRIFRAHGGRIVCSADSVEDIQNDKTINFKEIDIAIVDYMFDGCGKTGIDLVTYLKSKGVKQVCLCTGYFDDETVVRSAQNAGADLIIPKPLDEDKLKVLLG